MRAVKKIARAHAARVFGLKLSYPQCRRSAAGDQESITVSLNDPARLI